MSDVTFNTIQFPGLPDRYVIPYDKIWDILPSKALASAAVHAFADGADGIPIKAMSVQVEAVQNGTPAPDSPSPIVGWTQASVVDNGINQWDEVWEQGNINNSGENAPSNTIIRSKNYVRISPATEYYICGSGVKPYYYDEYKNFLNTAASKTNQTTTTPAGAYYMRFVQTGTSYGNNISINYPSTDTAYHAYAGRTVTMSFGESVYGGTLDLVNGKQWTLTIDRALVTLDSDFAGTIDLATNANTQQVLFRGAVTGADTTKLTDVITNYFEGGITSTTPNRARVSQRGNVFDVAISFPVGTFTDVADFKTNWMSGKTLQVVYFSATNRVVEIEADADTVTVYGDNVLYCDCGDSSLTYRQDIGLVINELSNAIVSLGNNT